MIPRTEIAMRRAWRRLHVGGYTWRVCFARDLHASDGEKVDGYADLEARTILLDAAIKRDREALRETLIHEIMHAAVWHADIDLGEGDEEIVTRLASALSQLLAPILRRLP